MDTDSPYIARLKLELAEESAYRLDALTPEARARVIEAGGADLSVTRATLDDRDIAQRQMDAEQRRLEADPNAPKPGFGMPGKAVLPPAPIPRQSMRVKVKPVRFKDEPTQTDRRGLVGAFVKNTDPTEYDALVQRYNGLSRRDFAGWILEATDLGKRLSCGSQSHIRQAAILARLVKGLRTTQNLDRILA